jgi:hypothetical protein
MDEQIGHWLAAWVDAVRRRPWLTLILAFVATCLAGLYASRNLGVNMDLQAMMSKELPRERYWSEIRNSFPDELDPLLVVVDAPTSEAAREAALALRDGLARDTHLFRAVEVPGESPFFDQNGLLYLSTDELRELADHLAEVQPYVGELQRDASLRGLFALLRRGADAIEKGDATVVSFTPVFTRLSASVDAAALGRPAPVSWHELLLGKGVVESKRRLVIAQPVVDYSQMVPAQAAIARVHEIAREANLEGDSGVRVRVTGELALSSEELDVVTRGTAVSGVISLVAVTVILIFGLRSWRLALANSVTLSAGLVWTFAFAAAAIGSLNLISVAFSVLFIGLADDFGVHFCMRWQDLCAHGRSSEEAMRETAGDVGFSLLICAATCVIGFLAFAPTAFRGVAELGVISAAGIVVSLFASLTVLPALVTVLNPPLPHGRARIFESGAFARLVSLPVRRARAIRIGALVLAIACLPFLLGVRFEYNPLNLRVPDSESVTAFNDLLETEDLSPWSAIVLAPDRAAADATARALGGLDTVDHTVTLSDYIPSDQPAKLAILEDVALFMAPPPQSDGTGAPPSTEEKIDALRRFVASATGSVESGANREAAAALAGLRASVSLFLDGLEGADETARDAALRRLERNVLGSLPDQLRRITTALGARPIDEHTLPSELVKNIVAPDGRVRVDAFPRGDISNDDTALFRFVESTAATAPTVTGIALTNVESAQAIMGAFREALIGAAIVITLLLLVLWRRVSDTLVALAPLALASLVLTAIMVVSGMRWNFANVLVLPVLLGIGIDSGIHLVHRWRHADHVNDALLNTSTARGVIQSTLTTIASFGALALSIHPGLASLGLLLTIGLVLILVANLVLIPALLAGRSLGPAAAPRSTSQ